MAAGWVLHSGSQTHNSNWLIFYSTRRPLPTRHPLLWQHHQTSNRRLGISLLNSRTNSLLTRWDQKTEICTLPRSSSWWRWGRPGLWRGVRGRQRRGGRRPGRRRSPSPAAAARARQRRPPGSTPGHPAPSHRGTEINNRTITLFRSASI